jgi:hypothetical protein
MMKFNALILPLVFGILFFTILNANISFAQLFQPGAQDKLLMPSAQQPNKKEVPQNTIIDQNKAPTTTIITTTLLSTNNTCNNNINRNHNSC